MIIRSRDMFARDPFNRPWSESPITPGDPTPGVMANCHACGLDFEQDHTTGARLCGPCLEKRDAEFRYRLDYPHKIPYVRAQRLIRAVVWMVLLALAAYFLAPVIRGIFGAG